MIYIKGNIYPYYLRQLRDDCPNISFPSDYNLAALAAVGVYPVAQTPAPTYNPFYETVAHSAVRLPDGTYQQSWQITPNTPEQTAANRAGQIVTMRQARLQLAALNGLTTINAAIASMPESAQIEWEYAADVQRTNPLVPAMQSFLGWTDEEMDAYFIAAAAL